MYVIWHMLLGNRSGLLLFSLYFNISQHIGFDPRINWSRRDILKTIRSEDLNFTDIFIWNYVQILTIKIIPYAIKTAGVVYLCVKTDSIIHISNAACVTLKCKNASICKKVAKCKDISTLNINIDDIFEKITMQKVFFYTFSEPNFFHI